MPTVVSSSFEAIQISFIRVLEPKGASGWSALMVSCTVRTDSGGFHWKLCGTIPINWVLLTNFLITQWDVSPPQLTSQMSQICYNLSLSLVISAMGNFCSRYNIEIIMFCKSCFNSLRCSVWVYELLPETRRTAHHVTACHKSEVDLGR